jgi:hypothetical protein
LQKEENLQELQHEVTIAPNPSWSIKWAGLLFAMGHFEILLTLMTLKIKEKIRQ